MTTKLLVLDDEQAILDLIRNVFRTSDLEIYLETDAEAALRCIAANHPNVAIFDISLPGGKSGIQVLREAKKIDPGLSVIMTTGYQSTQSAIDAMKYGAYDYLPKPFSTENLRNVVNKALECNLQNRKVRYSRDRQQVLDSGIDEDVMIGSSPEMIEIWKLVGKVAGSDATVMIQGESGTGKELLARAVHTNSRRVNRTFLAVNCAALPENLLESELFGHEKGAFTDAHTRRIGKFEQCNGGTMFLDEVSEMSAVNQGKLLRVLESQEFERVGGNETIKVDVRIIAATNKSLVNAVKEKTFRLDLFYRLRVVAFFLPPLRDRVEDIPLLVELFIRNFSRKYGKNVHGIAPDALQLLVTQPWEGNIRELRNVINSALVLCKGDYLLAEDFSTLIQPRLDIADVALKENDGDYYDLFSQVLRPIFDKVCLKCKGTVYDNLVIGLEKAVVQLALDRCRNNQVLAAELLGISRNTLRSRLERYRLDTPLPPGQQAE
jgi:two-component system, NtrC family, nitrogen regulation response regulator GlnG